MNKDVIKTVIAIGGLIGAHWLGKAKGYNEGIKECKRILGTAISVQETVEKRYKKEDES